MIQVKQLTKETLREKWPLKSESDLSKHLQQLQNSKQFLEDSIWQRLVQKLYPQGTQIVSDQLLQILAEKRNSFTLEYQKTTT